jgi:PilZ domain
MESSDWAEKRCEPRYKVFKAGKIVSADSSTVLDVSIKDISRGGARIKVTASIDIPDEFDLIIPADGVRHHCRICWRKGDQFGVQFTDVARRDVGIKPALIPDLQQKIDPRPPAVSPMALPGALPAISDNAQILAEMAVSLTGDSVSSDRGTCLVQIGLFNRGKIDAYQPFLCLPSLGLRLEAASGWQIQEVTLVRKMLRFDHVGSAVLVAGQSLSCCTIGLPFTTAHGGMLEFEVGNPHALGSLPDLRLTTIIGAGNFPTYRSNLVVPAASIRNLIVQPNQTPGVPRINE